ncbi:hypothetical protein MKEN_00501000 [Mycena kentingensis (nom. inval.)]|nr:hypothetical protein MKEN_00501000 [Mycena kentingensis (nom. inval.)]
MASNDPSNLPPKRKGPALRPVDAPLSKTRLNRLIYLLLLLSTLLSAYYGWRIMQWKTEVGGWWNLALGKKPDHVLTSDSPPKSQRKLSKHRSDAVEDRITALAKELGIPSRDLASAIAVAVKQHIPPASLSSIAAHQTGEAVSAMLKASEEDSKVAQGKPQGDEDDEGSAGIVGSVAEGVGAFVGMDEP